MKSLIVCGLMALTVHLCPSADVPPTDQRLWTAKSGHTIDAKVTGFKQGKVQLEKSDGERIVVPLDKLVKADQEVIEDHYNKAAAAEEAAMFAAEKPAEFDHALGQVTSPIDIGGGFTCLMYFPTTLRDDANHPVLFIQSPGGGNTGALNRYKQAAETNRWILATTPQSSNKLDYIPSYKAIEAMIGHVTKNYPIDKDRIYLSGFSGGSRYSFYTASMNDVAGIIACGAGASCHAQGEKIPGSKVVTYGLCGTNCFNRYDMAESHAKMENKDSRLRYFVGNHDWANSELVEDAAVYLNGVFFEKNGAKYSKQKARFEADILALIDSSIESSPHRAFMLADFLVERDLASGTRQTRLTRIHRELSASQSNVDYVKGLEDMDKMAKKVCGTPGLSYKTEYSEVVAAGEKYAKKYKNTPLHEIFLKFKDHVVQP